MCSSGHRRTAVQPRLQTTKRPSSSCRSNPWRGRILRTNRVHRFSHSDCQRETTCSQSRKVAKKFQINDKKKFLRKARFFARSVQNLTRVDARFRIFRINGSAPPPADLDERTRGGHERVRRFHLAWEGNRTRFRGNVIARSVQIANLVSYHVDDVPGSSDSVCHNAAVLIGHP